MTKKLSEAYRMTGTIDGLVFNPKKPAKGRSFERCATYLSDPDDLRVGDVVTVDGQPQKVEMVTRGKAKHILGLRRLSDGAKIMAKAEDVTPEGEPRVAVIGHAKLAPASYTSYLAELQARRYEAA